MQPPAILAPRDLQELSALIRSWERTLNKPGLLPSLPAGCIIRLEAQFHFPYVVGKKQPAMDLKLEAFFTEKRAREAGLSSKGMLTRVLYGLKNYEVLDGTTWVSRPIVRLEQLLELTARQLSRRPNMGRKSIEFIEKMLATADLELPS